MTQDTSLPVTQPNRPQTSRLALISLVCGIASIPLLAAFGAGVLVAIPAIVCGHWAVKEIRDSSGAVGGIMAAKAGLTMGWISVILVAAFLFIGFATTR
jgi:hypothetical protein